MREWDFHIAVVVWLLSIVSAYFFPVACFVVIATTFNLWHQRRVLYEHGRAFSDRVREVIGADIKRTDDRLKEQDRQIDDIKASQVQVLGQFRGNKLP